MTMRTLLEKRTRGFQEETARAEHGVAMTMDRYIVLGRKGIGTER